MHRAILQACFPLFLWLLAGFAGVWLVARVSGARLALGRLRRLHRCEEGSVQTLSFVLTLPIFMMLVLLIVQVSQLMIGVTVVHYAAFAAARAASVWFPAQTADEHANFVNGLSVPPPAWSTPTMNFYNGQGVPSWKCQKVWSAAVMALYPIAPSHQYLNAGALQSFNSTMANSTTAMYRQLVPAAQNNPQIASRIRNKAAYASEHTFVQISGFDYDDNSPSQYNNNNPMSYNPIGHPNPNIITDWQPNPGIWQPNSLGCPPQANLTGWQSNQIGWQQYQIGWQDPITVQVWFRFPLLTGPGRFLSPGHFLKVQLASPDGTPDKVSSRINIWDKNAHPGYVESVYWTQLTATATITTEGIKSIVPNINYPEPIN